MKIYVIRDMSFIWWIKFIFHLKIKKYSGKNLIKMYVECEFENLYTHLRGFITRNEIKINFVK